MTILLPLAGVIFVGAITPGPSNFAILAVATERGLVRTLPAILGVLGGALCLLLIVGIGGDAFLSGAPGIRIALAAIGSLYMGWLGTMMIARAGADHEAGSTAAVPARAVDLFLMQFLNPKGWAMTVTFVAATPSLLALAILEGVICGLCLLLWAAFGAIVIRRLAQGPVRRHFDRAMGAALIGSGGWLLVDVIS